MKKFYSLLATALFSASAFALTNSEGINYTVIPDPEVEQTSIKGPIVFTFPDFVSIYTDSDPDNPNVALDIMGHFTGNPYFLLGEISGNTISFSLDEPAYTKGEYTFSFDDGFYGKTADNTDVKVSPFNVTWSVTGEDITPGEYSIEISPEAGPVESLYDFSIFFKGATTISMKEDFSPKESPALYSVSSDGTRTKQCSSYSIIASKTTLSFKLQVTNPITVAGDYVLVVPAELLSVDGVALSEDLEFAYEISASSVDIPYSVNFIPESGSTVTTLDNIRTIFTSTQEDVTFKRDSFSLTSPRLYLLNEDGSYNSAITGSLSGDGDDFMWSAYYGAPENGNYAYVIPAGYITISDANGHKITNSENIIAYYTIGESSSISSAITEETEGEWFSIQGIKLEKRPSSGIYLMRSGNKVTKVIIK